jgi:hypothetical protein
MEATPEWVSLEKPRKWGEWMQAIPEIRDCREISKTTDYGVVAGRERGHFCSIKLTNQLICYEKQFFYTPPFSAGHHLHHTHCTKMC